MSLDQVERLREVAPTPAVEPLGDAARLDDDDNWWDGFAPPPEGQGVNGWMWAVQSFDDELVAGGKFDDAGGKPVNYIARWDGASWHALGLGVALSFEWPDSPSVYSLAIYDGDLIVGGDFTRAGGKPAYGIARWDGDTDTWSTFGDGMSAAVWGFTVYKGDLVACGSFGYAGGQLVRGVARWRGTHWEGFGAGMNTTVNDVAVYQGNLYACGFFTTAGGVAACGIARWDGVAWHALPAEPSFCGVAEFLLYNDTLIVGGLFPGIQGTYCTSYIARWNGIEWSQLGCGLSHWVYDLALYNDDLIAVGGFTWGSGQTLYHIARWSDEDSDWASLGSGINEFAMCVGAHDGYLFPGGLFTEAGGKPSNRIARWLDPATGVEGGPDTESGLTIHIRSQHPFGREASLAYEIPVAAFARVTVHDVSGRLLTTLAEGDHDAGVHRATWDGAGESGTRAEPGVYFVRLSSGGQTESMRIVLSP